MKTLIGICIGLGCIIGLFLITALFVKKDYTVEKEIIIRKHQQEVFSYILHIRNQENYSVWVQADPDMKKDYRGTDGTIGFVSAWDSEKAGKGEQEIRNIEEGKRLDLELRFKKPFESTAHAYFTTEPVGQGETRVKWGMKGSTPYPMNFMNLFSGKILGNDLEKSLNNLKTLLESN